MKFLAIYRPSRPEGAPASPDEYQKVGQLIGEMQQAGVLLATEGCLPSERGARIRYRKGQFVVTDGPFTETKELIAGFALIRVASKAEAVKWTKRFLEAAGDGESEIREIAE